MGQQISKEDLEEANKKGILKICKREITKLDLSSIPSELRNKLEILDASHNLITEIPKKIATFNNLNTLDLSMNKLSTLPSEISTLKNLEYLRLSNNEFEVVPECVLNLPSLKMLNIYENKLTHIPEELNQIPTLTEILIACNYLDFKKTSAELYLKLRGVNDQHVPSKILSNLYLGSYSSSRYEKGLDDRNIKHILIVGNALKPKFEGKINYKIIKLEDMETEDITQFFEDMICFIEEGRKTGGVLVHCAAGVSRSASAIVAYIIKIKCLEYEAALEYVKKKRPCICPNDGFVKQLKLYSEASKKSNTKTLK